MGDIHFFEIPVYRLAYDLYNTQRNQMLTDYISDMTRGIPDYKVPEENKMAIDQHLYEKYGPWRFNEIIGYIRLHFLGSQIRGEYFSAEKKRNGLSRHKVFTYRTHKLAAEVDIQPASNATNAEIFASIEQYIIDCRSELTKGRVIDDSILRTIGPHVDWRSLLGRK